MALSNFLMTVAFNSLDLMSFDLYRCDMHPHSNCIDGEDELDCFDDYISKGLVSKSADFICQSPFHNDGQTRTATVKILATACDGNPECWKADDEQNCNLNGIQYTIGEMT